MAQVLIRNVDPRLVEIYKARAARNGRDRDERPLLAALPRP